jgi:hypothetical protein
MVVWRAEAGERLFVAMLGENNSAGAQRYGFFARIPNGHIVDEYEECQADGVNTNNRIYIYSRSLGGNIVIF